MKRTFHLVRTTLTGGVLFLVPIVVVFMILEKALNLAHKLVAPLAKHIPFESLLGLPTPVFLAVGLLLLFCFLAGLLARTVLAQKFVNWLETTVLSNLPGYGFFKAVGESMLGVDKPKAHQVVLAHLDDAWQFGFVTEHVGNGLLAVFIPDAPNPHSGSVHLLSPDKVTSINVPPHAALNCLKRLGTGSNALVGGLVLEGRVAKPPDSLKTLTA